MFSGRVQAYLQQVAFTNDNVSFNQGDVVDFTLTWGGGVNSEYGWTDVDAVIAEELILPCVLAQSPSPFTNQSVSAIMLNLSEPVVGADARASTNYTLIGAGPDRLFGTADDRAI